MIPISIYCLQLLEMPWSSRYKEKTQMAWEESNREQRPLILGRHLESLPQRPNPIKTTFPWHIQAHKIVPPRNTTATNSKQELRARRMPRGPRVTWRYPWGRAWILRVIRTSKPISMAPRIMCRGTENLGTSTIRLPTNTFPSMTTCKIVSTKSIPLARFPRSRH